MVLGEHHLAQQLLLGIVQLPCAQGVVPQGVNFLLHQTLHLLVETGIRAKIDELKIFVLRLKNIGFAFSAICIQETWLSDKDSLTGLKLDDYEIIDQPYACTPKGGLIIYLHNKFKHDELMKLTNYENWEGQVI